MIVPGFVRRGALAGIHDAYPEIRDPGSFPYGSLEYGPAFAALIAELQGPEMRAAIETVFDIDLTGRPTTVTVRGQCQQKDGRIPTRAPCSHSGAATRRGTDTGRSSASAASCSSTG